MDFHLIIFFLDDFHHGVINHVTHFIGFTILGYGLGKWSWKIIVVSPFIMELGHVYNYFRGVHVEHAISIIPVQLLAWVIFVACGYLVAQLVKKAKKS